MDPPFNDFQSGRDFSLHTNCSGEASNTTTPCIKLSTQQMNFIGFGISIFGFCFAVCGFLILLKKKFRNGCKANDDKMKNKKKSFTSEVKREMQNPAYEEISPNNEDEENVFIDNELYTSSESLCLERGFVYTNIRKFHLYQPFPETADLNQKVTKDQLYENLQDFSQTESPNSQNEMKPMEHQDMKLVCRLSNKEPCRYISSMPNDKKNENNLPLYQDARKSPSLDFPLKALNSNRQGNSFFMEDTNFPDNKAEDNVLITPQNPEENKNIGIKRNHSLKITQTISKKGCFNNNVTHQKQLNKMEAKSDTNNCINEIPSDFSPKNTFEVKSNNFIYQCSDSDKIFPVNKTEDTFNNEEFADNPLYDDPQEILQENNYFVYNPSPTTKGAMEDEEFVYNSLYDAPQHILQGNNHPMCSASPIKEISIDNEESFVDNSFYDDPQEILQENNHPVSSPSPIKEGSRDDEEFDDNSLYDDPQEILQENNYPACRSSPMEDEKFVNSLYGDPQHILQENNPPVCSTSPIKEISVDNKEEFVDNSFYDDPQEILQENYYPTCRSSPIKEGSMEDEEEFVDNSLYDGPQHILPESNHLFFSTTPTKEGSTGDNEEEFVDNPLYDDPQHNHPACSSSLAKGGSTADDDEESVHNSFYNDPPDVLQETNHPVCCPSSTKQDSMEEEEKFAENSLYGDLQEILQENNHSVLNIYPTKGCSIEEEFADNSLYDDSSKILQQNNNSVYNPFPTKEGSVDDGELFDDNVLYQNSEEILQENNHSEDFPSPTKEDSVDCGEVVDNCLYSDSQEILQ